MTDPLAEVITLLRPTVELSKTVLGAGSWRAPRAAMTRPFYCVVLEGQCRAKRSGSVPMELHTSDFVLSFASCDIDVASFDLPEANADPTVVQVASNTFRLGGLRDPPDLRMLTGHYHFESQDAPLLVSLLPPFVHVHGHARLTALVQLINDEWSARRPAREVVLARLLEVLLIEALRSTAETPALQGLVRGLADPRIGNALRAMHAHPEQAWTVPTLAQTAALSRSALFERFNQRVGVAPMAYLMAWRMALAQRLLRESGVGIAEVARRVGYGSASTFSTAFTRHVGIPPSRYMSAYEAGNLLNE